MALLAAGCGTVATTPGGSVVIQQGPDLSWLAALGISVHGTNALVMIFILGILAFFALLTMLGAFNK